MSLIIFILASLGMTNIIVRENIFAKIREFIDKKLPYSMLNKIMTCLTCCGFWVGIILTLLFPSLGINWLIGGCISSICNKIVGLLLYKF